MLLHYQWEYLARDWNGNRVLVTRYWFIVDAKGVICDAGAGEKHRTTGPGYLEKLEP